MNIINDISWERTNLILKFDEVDKNSKFILTNQKEEFELKSENNQIKILLTNTPEGTILPEGKWNILSNLESVRVTEKIISKLDDLSRIYKYKGNTYAYIVTFSINENMELSIHTQFMMKNKKPEKVRPLFEAKKIKKKIKNVIQIISLAVANVIYKIVHTINFKKQNSVLFLNENGDELQGNSLFFYNYLITRGKYNIKKYCKNVFTKKLNYFERLSEIISIASCSYIIVDNYTPLLTYLNIGKDVKLIQLWHAGVGFKAVGYARFGQKGSPHPFISGHRKYDYAIVDNESLIDVYEEVFGISKSKFIPVGMPRLEGYLNEDKIKKTINNFYQKNKNLKNKKIILFAPTYRGTGQVNAYYDMDMINQDKLADFCKKNNFITIFKFHPFVNNKIEIKEEYKDIFYDYTFQYDINDIFYITDVLITDYSSCAYEYSLFDRPIIFYRYDKVLYEYLRKMHTKDVFSKETYETKDFNELIDILQKLSNKPKCSIKKDIKNLRNTNSCSIIEKNIFEG